MPPYPNLVSESLLVNLTIDLLASVGGKIGVVDIVEKVMKISDPEPKLARLLASDLVETDPRLRMSDDAVELIETDHDILKLDETDFVVFDLETTGAKAPPCRVTEIGACRIANGEITDRFQSLVNPEEPIPEFITALTGIDDTMVSTAPVFGEVVPGLLDFIGDSVLVAHNSSFDIGFLNFEIGRLYQNYRLANPSLCTVQLSRQLVPDIENHKLKTVANHFSIELVNHHRAADDACAAAGIFLNLLEAMRLRGIRDLGAARRLCRQKRYAKRTEAAA
ncbi:MAG TPA: exonuclease domain-containing protein [Pyrinomonadaceae bacterium]|nr:exonuclease domain-containing protein [Pyrinomonadaceae bacterium]